MFPCGAKVRRKSKTSVVSGSRSERAVMSDVDSPRTRRRSFWLWFVGVPAMVLLAVISLATLYMGSTGNQRFDAGVSVAVRDDPDWRLEDLMAHREAVADDENAAIVVARAAALLPEGWQLGRAAGSGAERAGTRQFRTRLNCSRKRTTTFGLTRRSPLRSDSS